MRKLFHSWGMVSLLALCCAFAGRVQAQENTFGGAIAPSQTHTPSTKQEPQGYRGVMPGHVAPVPKPEVQADTTDETPVKPVPTARAPRNHAVQEEQPDTPARGARKPRMSMRPGASPPKPLTAEDLRQIAALTGIEVRMDKLANSLADAVHMPAHVYPLVSLPQPRVDGMLPMEVSAKGMIDKSMQDIKQASALSPEARRKAIDDSITALSNFARGARIERDMPADIYETVGAPPLYVSESREGAGKAAERLQEALKNLRKMQ